MSYKQSLKKISTFIFDVDGVLTDSSVILDPSGEMIRSMNTRDGYAMQHAIKKGYNLCIITGGNSPMVKMRLNYLGIKDVYLEVKDKCKIMVDYINKKNINYEEILYMGDDIPDMECMKLAGISACPHDAAVEVSESADYISHINGGKGCVREILEQTMRLHGNWFDKDV